MWKKTPLILPSVSFTHMSDRYVFCIEGKVQCRGNWCVYTKFSETACKIRIVKLTHSCTITMKNHMKRLNMKASPAASELESPSHFLMITVKCRDPKIARKSRIKGAQLLSIKILWSVWKRQWGKTYLYTYNAGILPGITHWAGFLSVGWHIISLYYKRFCEPPDSRMKAIFLH